MPERRDTASRRARTRDEFDGLDDDARAYDRSLSPELGWYVAVAGAVLAAIGIVARIVQRQRERHG